MYVAEAHLNVTEEGRPEALDDDPHDKYQGTNAEVLYRTEWKLDLTIALAHWNVLRCRHK